MIRGDTRCRLEQPFLQRDQTIDGLLLRIAARVVLVVAVVATCPYRAAGAVFQRIGGHYHVVGRGIERLERHQIQLASRCGHHEVHPVGQHLLHAIRAQRSAVEGKLKQVERCHRGTELGRSRCLNLNAGRGDRHNLDSLGRGPAIQR